MKIPVLMVLIVSVGEGEEADNKYCHEVSESDKCHGKRGK